MRIGSAWLYVIPLALFGCGGTLVLHSDQLPRETPAPSPSCAVHHVGSDEAAQIVVAEASRRHGRRHFEVARIEQHKRYWKVELRSAGHHADHSEVQAKVDRVTGEILSFKSRDRDDD